MPRKPRPKKQTPGDLAAEQLEFLSVGKQGYKTADSALELLISETRVEDCPTCGAARFKNNGIVVAKDGSRYRIKDKFADRNVVNVGQNVRRFEVEPLPG